MSENIKTVELEKMKLAIFAQIAPELAEHFVIKPEVGMSAHSDWYTDMLTIRIIQSVYGEEVKKKEVTYPADWWQAFKERWFPERLKTISPVEYRTEVMSASAIYPHVSAPELSHQIVITKRDL